MQLSSPIRMWYFLIHHHHHHHHHRRRYFVIGIFALLHCPHSPSNNILYSRSSHILPPLTIPYYLALLQPEVRHPSTHPLQHLSSAFMSCSSNICSCSPHLTHQPGHRISHGNIYISRQDKTKQDRFFDHRCF